MKINLDKAKEIAHSVPGFVPVFRPLYRKTVKRFLESKNREVFHREGLAVMKDFHDCLTRGNVYYTLAFGTLLGAIREKGFIKHDNDIDVNIWAEDYSVALPDILESNGFKLIHRFLIDEGRLGREETYMKDGVGIDVFYIYRDDQNAPYCCDFLHPEGCISYSEGMKKYGGVISRKLYLPFEKLRKLTPFENYSFFVPENSHELLKARYGDTYMIPNPQWGIRSYDENIVVWEGFNGIYESFE